jgi:oligo-1,6-glucosidase
MRATPYYYAGDELGMSNIKFDNIQDYRDIETLNYYKKLEAEGGDLQHFLNGQKISARDNGRTPFQWDGTENAGFSKTKPWLKVNPNYKTVNVAAEEKDPNSTLHYFRKMVKLRKSLPELVYGAYHLMDEKNKNVYAYTRTLGNKSVAVVMNFSAMEVMFDLPSTLKPGEVLINNLPGYKIKNGTIRLEAYQAIIIRIKN